MRSAKVRKILDGKIKLMPCVGMKAGDFHTLERELTPIFVNYVNDKHCESSCDVPVMANAQEFHGFVKSAPVKAPHAAIK